MPDGVETGYEFWERNGFARLDDLQSPRLREVRATCLREQRSLSGQVSLDWSRQWEYPFVLANLPEAGRGARLLDAGSGFRFFTPLTAERGFRVDACDLDERIGPQLDALAQARGLDIAFSTQDLEHLSYADDSFDHIACISVLEHTESPTAVIAEFTRCLRPGGSLILTFDVSLDGDRVIPLPKARELIEALESQLEPRTPFDREWLLDDGALAESDDVLRTAWFREHEPGLLPWGWISRAALQHWSRGRWGRPFFDLAVVGMVLRKRGIS